MKAIFSKILLLVVTVVCISSTAVFADFTDMPDDAYAKTTLEKAVENGLLTGYENGEIRPYDKITRAQMATILVRAFGATNTADITKFPDMNPSQWYYDAMSKAVAMEIFQGDGVNLNPEANITFQEAFAVLSRVFDLQTEYQVNKLKYDVKLLDTMPVDDYYAIAKYSDGDTVAKWAMPTTETILEGGYWDPADKLLRPTEHINRLEFAILMNNLVTTYIDQPGTYDSLPEGNVVIRCDDVVIDNFKYDCDVFVGDGVNSGVLFGSNVDIDRLIIRNGVVGVGGAYNQIRMIGHNCLTDISYGPTVRIQLYSRYPAESKVSLGIKELG